MSLLYMFTGVLIAQVCSAYSFNNSSTNVSAHYTNSSLPSLKGGWNETTNHLGPSANKKIVGEEKPPEVKCERRKYNPNDYRIGVTMLKSYCAKNWINNKTIYAAVVRHTAVYVCADKRADPECTADQWDEADVLMNENCGENSVATARVQGKVYGRGEPDVYRCKV